jgi:hypothetical protein
MKMRILSGVMISAVLCGAAFAAPASTSGPHSTTTAVHPPASTQPDCQKMGSDVSALIDQKKDSENIAAARSVFQVGIMECMEGSDDAANTHYQQAKNLLAGPPGATDSIRVPSR